MIIILCGQCDQLNIFVIQFANVVINIVVIIENIDTLCLLMTSENSVKIKPFSMAVW
jgi:hypothetical protein